MKLPVLTLDTPNKNNRIYPLSVFDDIKEVPKTGVLVYKTENNLESLSDVIGVVDDLTLDVETKIVSGNIILLNTPEGNISEAMLKAGQLFLRTSGEGMTTKQPDGSYLVTDYKINGFFLTNNPA
jgi:hypothetical protein